MIKMMDWILQFRTDETHIAIWVLLITVILYECKFNEPISFFAGKPKLFEGTKKQKIYSWIMFIIMSILFLWVH